MSVEVYTIEHTGTRFVLDILNRAGLGKLGRAKSGNRIVDPAHVFSDFPPRKNPQALPPLRCHCSMVTNNPHYPDGWEEPGDDTRLVVTVRNPLDCLQSWWRKKNRENLLPNFIATWAHFLWRLEGREVFYFALDTDDRQGQIESLLNYCGCSPQDWVADYAKDWTPIGQSSGESLEVTDQIRALLRFATEWYEYHTWGTRQPLQGNVREG